MIGRGLRLAAVAACLLGTPAAAGAGEQEVRAAVDAFYAELRKGLGRRLHALTAPGAVIEPRRQPDRTRPRKRSADLSFDPYGSLLAVRAELFRPEVGRVVVEDVLAKVEVWERGFIYAWAAKQTYENAAAATFVFERREGGWKVLLYHSGSQAVRTKDRDEPLPDLSPGAADADQPGKK